VPVALAGVANLRDLGGLPFGDSDGGGTGRASVRPGVVFRSAALDRLTAGGAVALGELGVRTVLDLRDDFEASGAPDLLAGTAVRYVRVPIFGSSPGMRWLPGVEGLYRDFVDACGGAFASCLRYLASDEAAPALVHCAVGKDRTGFLVALLLSVAGVEDSVIAADFAASNVHLGLADPDDRSGRPSTPVSVGTGAHHYVQPRLITGALERVRSAHGSVDGFLLHHGLTRPELDRLRAMLR
jgi:protein-tyrosine phosphatase